MHPAGPICKYAVPTCRCVMCVKLYECAGLGAINTTQVHPRLKCKKITSWGLLNHEAEKQG